MQGAQKAGKGRVAGKQGGAPIRPILSSFTPTLNSHSNLPPLLSFSLHPVLPNMNPPLLSSSFSLFHSILLLIPLFSTLMYLTSLPPFIPSSISSIHPLFYSTPPPLFLPSSLLSHPPSFPQHLNNSSVLQALFSKFTTSIASHDHLSSLFLQCIAYE